MASNRSLLLFGHGDGGGGPAISHFEKLRRLKPCESVARIHTDSHPNDFFLKVYTLKYYYYYCYYKEFNKFIKFSDK